ncbi:MAG: hypothetical protein ACOCV1_05505 [Bacillota bacterium]
MKRYNDDFVLDVYNQFKMIASDYGRTFTEHFNKLVPYCLSRYTEDGIKSMVDELEEWKDSEKVTRSIALKDHNHGLIKDFIENTSENVSFSIKDVIHAVMVHEIREEQDDYWRSIEDSLPAFQFSVPKNIYNIKEGPYIVMTNHIGFPEDFLSSLEQDNLKTKWFSEDDPEYIVEDNWFYIKNMGLENNKYWVPEYFLSLAVNSQDHLKEMYKRVIETIEAVKTVKPLKDFPYQTYLVIEPKYINRWERQLLLRAVVYTDMDNSEDIREYDLDIRENEDENIILPGDIVVNIDNISLLDMENVVENSSQIDFDKLFFFREGLPEELDEALFKSMFKEQFVEEKEE